MKSVWFRPEHYKNKNKKDDYEAALRNSRVLIDRLLEIIDARLEAVEDNEICLENYDDGAAFKLAFLNGQKKELKEIKDLFSFVNDKTNN